MKLIFISQSDLQHDEKTIPWAAGFQMDYGGTTIVPDDFINTLCSEQKELFDRLTAACGFRSAICNPSIELHPYLNERIVILYLLNFIIDRSILGEEVYIAASDVDTIRILRNRTLIESSVQKREIDVRFDFKEISNQIHQRQGKPNRYSLTKGLGIFRAFIGFLLVKRKHFNAIKRTNCRTVLIGYHPNTIKSRYDTGMYCNAYFEGVERVLSDLAEPVLAYIPTPDSWFSAEDIERQWDAASPRWPTQSVNLLSFLTTRSLVSIAYQCLKYFFARLFLMDFRSKVLPLQADLSGFKTFVRNLIISYCFDQFLKVANPRVVIYCWENQSWERYLNFCVRTKYRCVTVGLQHAQYKRHNFRTYSLLMHSLSQPNFLLLNHQKLINIWRKMGVDESLVELREVEQFRRGPSREKNVQGGEGDIKIYGTSKMPLNMGVFLSYDEAESRALLDVLEDWAESTGLHKDSIRIRKHPMAKWELELKNSRWLRFSEASISRLISECSLCIAPATTSVVADLYESGVPSVLYHAGGLFDLGADIGSYDKPFPRFYDAASLNRALKESKDGKGNKGTDSKILHVGRDLPWLAKSLRSACDM